MKKLAFLVIAVALVYGFLQEQGIRVPSLSSPSSSSDTTLQTAYKNQQSDLQVRGAGVVTKILPDDLQGSKHQKFILKMSSGQSVLVSHNIDLAPRISELQTGDKIEFYGEYEWNAKGGVIHWTHHDPNHRHVDGWLRHEGKSYR